MCKYLLVLALLLFQTVSVRVFLMGGAVNNNETEIYVNLAAATGKKPAPNKCDEDWKTTTCPKIAVITSAAGSEQDGNDAYLVDETGSLSYKSLFALYGFTSKHVSVHIDNYLKTTDLSTTEGQSNLQIIRQADVIFFNGGDQARHARSWLNDDGSYNKLMQVVSDRAIRNEAILSGTSAGSMIMCNPIYGSGGSYGHLYFANKIGLAQKKVSDGGVNGTGLADTRNGTKGIQYQDNGGIMPGFQFVPFLSDTHFDARGRLARIVPGMIQTKKDFGVGVDQSTAFFYDNGKGTAYGKNGVFIADIFNATRNVKEYFSINNVNVNYLTSGDSFQFSTRKVTPQKSKFLIQKPAYSGHTDSTDILASYEITKILTRLGDQTSTFNIGRSKTPKGYPSNAPTFKLTFQKTATMQSYWSSSQRKYTDANVTVSFAYE